MYIISVCPTSNIPRQSILEYFHKSDLPKGTLVSLSYGHQKIKGIVIDSTDIRQVKNTVKQTDFQLKKITDIIETQKIPEKTIEAIIEFSENYFIPIGKILSDIYPVWYWEVKTISKEKEKNSTNPIFIESTLKNRFEEYQKYISQNTISWIIVPTLVDIAQFKKNYKNPEIELIIFSGKISTEKQQLQYKKLLELNNTPTKNYIIISTPYYLGIANPVADLLIFEKYGHSAYHLNPLYSYDIRMLEKNLAQNSLCIHGDTLLPLHLTQEKNHKKSTDILQYTLYTKEKGRADHVFIHEKMKEDFEIRLQKKESILLVSGASEKNLKIVCNDCKTMCVCPTCESYLVLKETTKENLFYCSFCKKNFSSRQKCITCTSWDLYPIGINKKTVELYVEKYYSDYKKYITIATEDTLYLHDSLLFTMTYALSLDSFIYKPQYNSEEELYRAIQNIAVCTKKLSIQTTLPFPNVFAKLKTLSFDEWLKKEYTDRKENRFPPYGIIYYLKAIKKEGIPLIQKIKESFNQKNALFLSGHKYIQVYGPLEKEMKINTYLSKFISKYLLLSKEKGILEK